jgi:uncharacterized lipoprotein YajG
MIKKIITIFCAVALFSSCKTSMTPIEVHNTLPKYTKTTFLTASQAQNSNCTCLTKDRSYTAPIGMTVNADLRNGAKGIDEWVALDGGNAYVLRNFQ